MNCKLAYLTLLEYSCASPVCSLCYPYQTLGCCIRQHSFCISLCWLQSQEFHLAHYPVSGEAPASALVQLNTHPLSVSMLLRAHEAPPPYRVALEHVLPKPPAPGMGITHHPAEENGISLATPPTSTSRADGNGAGSGDVSLRVWSPHASAVSLLVKVGLSVFWGLGRWDLERAPLWWLLASAF
jgi:hypothetical protein